MWHGEVMRRTIAALTLAAAWLPAAAAHAETAAPAQKFTDSVGVNTHMPYANTPYGTNPSAIRDRLAELRVRHVRDGVCATCPSATAAQQMLGRSGVKFTFQVGQNIGRNATTTTVDDHLDTIIDNGLLPYTEAVEGINEPDLQQDPDWQAKTLAQQEQIRRRIDTDPRLTGLKALGASAGRFENVTTFARLSELADFGNIHPYPGGHTPEYALDNNLPAAKAAWGGKPLIITETGYQNATNGFWSPHKPVTMQVAAAYYPRLYLENFRRGIPRTFAYELADNWNDPLLLNQEAAFGLLRNNLTAKPAFTSVANLMALLDDRGPAVAGDLDLTVAGSGVSHLLLSRSDGSFDLALWNTNSIWTPEYTWPVADQPRAATVTIPAAAHMTVYRPTQGLKPLQEADGDRMNLSVPADPLIVHITPADDDSAEQTQNSQQNEPENPDDTQNTQDQNLQELNSQEQNTTTTPETTVTVRLVNPRRGQRYRVAPLLLAAARADGSKLYGVRFFVDGRQVAADRSFPFAARMPRKLAFGKHTVTASAYAVDGTEAASAPVTVTRVR